MNIEGEPLNREESESLDSDPNLWRITEALKSLGDSETKRHLRNKMARRRNISTEDLENELREAYAADGMDFDEVMSKIEDRLIDKTGRGFRREDSPE